jgi:hypothetical protein
VPYESPKLLTSRNREASLSFLTKSMRIKVESKSLAQCGSSPRTICWIDLGRKVAASSDVGSYYWHACATSVTSSCLFAAAK